MYRTSTAASASATTPFWLPDPQVLRAPRRNRDLDAARQKSLAVTGRVGRFPAQWLSLHVDFPLLQRLALLITIGSVRYRGTQIHETRVIRLLEEWPHAGSHLGGGSAKQIHQRVLTILRVSPNALDLRKLKSHSLLEAACH